MNKMTFYELKELIGHIVLKNRSLLSKDQLMITEVCPTIELESFLIISVTFKFNRDQQEIIRVDDEILLSKKCDHYVSSVYNYKD